MSIRLEKEYPSVLQLTERSQAMARWTGLYWKEPKSSYSQDSKNSRFKGLRLPENCIRLKSRKMFAEESSFQNNCVAGYIDNVNQDLYSIWSMRKEDGSRNTIEIVIRRGRFCIVQMLGYDNWEFQEKTMMQ